MMSLAQPIKADVIAQSLDESIVMSYYLLPPVNHHQLTDLISSHNDKDEQWLTNQKLNTYYIANL